MRQRSFELERAQRAIARREVLELSEDEGDCEIEVGAGGRGVGPFQPFAARRRGLGRECIQSEKREERERRRREYEQWSFCGR